MPFTSSSNSRLTSSAPRRFVEGLSPDVPFFVAVESCFRQRLNAVLYYLALVTGREEPLAEQVHKLRVASRRLQAVLESLPEAFPEAPRKRLRKLAQEIRRAGERSRTLEVRRTFLEELLPKVTLEEAAAVERLCDRAVQQRKKSHKKLLREVPRLTKRLMRAGRNLLAEMNLPCGHSQEAPTFVEAGSLALSRQLDALWQQSARDHESPESMHQLRLAGKRLRYTLELFVPVLNRSFHDDFLPQLEHIQELLGNYHDAVEGHAQMRREYKKWKRRIRNRHEKADCCGSISWEGFRSGLDAIALAYEQQAEQARAEFQDLWPGFSGESFRFPIEQLLAEIFAESVASTAGRITPEIEGQRR